MLEKEVCVYEEGDAAVTFRTENTHFTSSAASFHSQIKANASQTG